MATIKAGTIVTWNDTVRFEGSTDDFLPAINNLSIYFTSNNTAFSSFNCRCDVDNGVGYFYYLPSSPFVQALTPNAWGSADVGYYMDFLPTTEYKTFTVTQDVELTDDQYAELSANATIEVQREAKFVRLIREDEIPSSSVEYMTVKVTYKWDVDFGTGSAVVINNGDGGELSATFLNDYNTKTLTLTLPYTGNFSMTFTPDDSAIDHGRIFYTFDGTEPSYNNTVERLYKKTISLSNIEKGVVLWVYIDLSD